MPVATWFRVALFLALFSVVACSADDKHRANATSGGAGIFSSTDGGAHWTRILAPSAANAAGKI